VILRHSFKHGIGDDTQSPELPTFALENVNLSRHEAACDRKGSKERIIPLAPELPRCSKTYAEELRPLLAPSPYFIVKPCLTTRPELGTHG